LIEVQGGTHNGGKHGRGAGILTDMTKLAVAHKNGWRLFQVPATVPQAKRIFPMIADVIVANAL
jgi:hypothetical protein